MKRIFVVLLMLIFILTLAANGNTVEASSPTHNTDLMLISITDVEIVNEIANGDEELFVETLAQMGYDNNVIVPVYELGDFHSYTDGATPIYLPEIQIDDRRSEPGPIIMPMSLLPEDEEVLINVE